MSREELLIALRLTQHNHKVRVLGKIKEIENVRKKRRNKK